jgi:hypothetical protein
LRGAPIRTHCGHLFHATCLKKYLRGHSNVKGQACPGCRAANPLDGAQHLDDSGPAHFSFRCDMASEPLECGRSYRVVAVLCQDEKAVADSALVIDCVCLRLDLPAQT